MNRPISHKHSDFLLYTGNDGKINIEVFLEDESVWLTQKAMSKLFSVNTPAISKHIANIYETGEVEQTSTVSILESVQKEGSRQVKRKLEYYNLDVIISVGYRVNSVQATQFRIWATRTLKEFIIKGFVLDDERLKQGSRLFGKDYFDELLERIREIRASERRFYQKITDLYTLSADYNKEAPVTKAFFASVQNKLHWAITGKTAAEIIYDSADASKLYMGLSNWKQAPDGKIIKSDTTTAKNYLSKAHITELNQIISAYLDLAENRAQRQIVMKMNDWVEFLHDFLELSNYPLLQDKGKVSAAEAKLKAEHEYETYRVKQDKEFISDFDKEVKRLTEKNDER
ncbi:MAG: virulence RhuM family protein [Bacteroidota bacterium]|nr:virulence RhuM family protein [Bacteroidota bacterium]